MNKDRIDELERDYVLTIQNERDWYTSAMRAFSDDAPLAFRSTTHRWIGVINRREGKTTSPREIDFIVASLFVRAIVDEYDPPKACARAATLAQERLNGYYERAAGLSAADATPAPCQQEPEIETLTKEQEIMNATAFATKHFIFGQDTSAMTEDQLIEAIKKIEAEIANLKQVKTASKKIGARIEELNAMLTNVVGVLDAK